MARESTDGAASVAALEGGRGALALERRPAQVALGGPQRVLRLRSLGVDALASLSGALDGCGRRALGLLGPRDLAFERAALLSTLAFPGALGGGSLAFGRCSCLRGRFGSGRRLPLRAAALEHPEAATVAEPGRRPERLLETPGAHGLT